jgi:tRNA pseudouridine13 synthase
MNPRDLTSLLLRLPYVTDVAQRLPGRLKSTPGHFQVREIMPYTPCGKGEHVYVTLRRAGWNTLDVARKLAEVLGADYRQMGWAGMKDKHALTTQTFSLKMALSVDVDDVSTRLADHTPFDILNTARHTNKIRIGHVRANRFRIVLDGCPADMLPAARVDADAILDRGLPNFYGPQRFGKGFGNVAAALRRFGAKPVGRRRPNGKFWVSVLQAAWFNVWLAERMALGAFNRILNGDIAKKRYTGGLFTVSDTAEAQERLDRRELTYTGPIFGTKTMPAAGEAGGHEQALCRRFGIDSARLQRMKSPGARRPALLWLDDIRIEPADAGLVFSFELPSGAYATALMREFIGDEPTCPDR